MPGRCAFLILLPVCERWLIGRLAPDCRRTGDELKLLHAIGWETANLQLGTKRAVRRVVHDLKKRPAKWLGRATEAMTMATLRILCISWCEVTVRRLACPVHL